MLHRERISLRNQVESLWRTVQVLKDRDRCRNRTPSSDGTIRMYDSPVSRRSRNWKCSSRHRDHITDDVTREIGSENLSPVYRPPLLDGEYARGWKMCLFCSPESTGLAALL